MSDRINLTLLESSGIQKKSGADLDNSERDITMSNNEDHKGGAKNSSVARDETERYWNYEEEKHYLMSGWTCANQDLLLGILKILELFKDSRISLNELNFQKESYFATLNLQERFSKEYKKGKDSDLVDGFQWSEVHNQDFLKSLLSNISQGILGDVCEFLDSHMCEFAEWKAQQNTESAICETQEAQRVQ